MNKKLNTFLFLIAGTIVNVILMLLMLFVLLRLISFVITPDMDNKVVASVTLTAVMLSVVGSYFVYSKIVKLANSKWNLEKYIDPIFRKRKP